MSLIRITDAADPRIADYRNVPDPELLRRRGLFIAENRLVVRTLLASTRFRTRSVLLTDAAYASLQGVLAPSSDEQAEGGTREIDVYVCPKALMQPISGFHIHRGCLALGERPAPVGVADLLASFESLEPSRSARSPVRFVVVEGVTNADNVGAIFRNARAFGVNGVVVGPRCCDPLYRKAIRVSIGATLVVPFAQANVRGRPQGAAPTDADRKSQGPEPVGADPRVGPLREDLLALKRAGFTLVGLTPAADAVDLGEYAEGAPPDRVALLVGNEGEGLSPESLEACDARVRIAMAEGVDSLNAGTATGIALHRLGHV